MFFPSDFLTLLSPMHTSKKLNLKTINSHADGVTWKLSSRTMLLPQQHITTGQFFLRCSWIRVVSAEGLWQEGTDLLHPAGRHCTTQQVKTVSPAQTLICLMAMVNEIENCLQRHVTMKWARKTMILYIPELLLSTEFIACTRDEKHCYMKLKTSGQELVSKIKFGIVFGIIFFL